MQTEVVITLHEMTIALVGFKALFFFLLTAIIFVRSGTRARQEDRPRTVEELSIVVLMLTLAWVSMADFDLIQETDAQSWWRFSVRLCAFIAEWWVLATLIMDWRRERDGRRDLRVRGPGSAKASLDRTADAAERTADATERIANGS